MKRLQLIIGGLLIASLSAYSNLVTRITIESATEEAISQTVIYNTIQLKEGHQFSQSRLSEDIKRLYRTDLFDDIVVFVEDDVDGNIEIRWRVTLHPKIEAIGIGGNTHIDSKDLHKKLQAKKGDRLNYEQLSADKEALEKLYNRKGYTNAIIEQRIKRIGKTHVLLLYHINEGEAYKVRGINFKGNTVFSDRKLRKMIKTRVPFFPFLGWLLSTGKFDRKQWEQDLEKIQVAYYDKGYLDCRIGKVEEKLDASGSLIYLDIFLDEGKPYQLGELRISGNKEIPDAKLLPLLKIIKSGSLYSRSIEAQHIQLLSAIYNRRGYIDNRIYAQRSIDPVTLRVSIEYKINEGPISTIHNIDITGNKYTHDEVIRRALTIHPGDLADKTKMDSSRLRLLNLGYFSQVYIFPYSTSNPDEKDLIIRVEENETASIGLRGGFSSVEKFIFGVSYNEANFDVSGYPRFRGGGQRFGLSTGIGKTRTNVSLSFTEPWLFDRPLRMDLGVWHRTTSSNRAFEEKATGFSVAFTRRLGPIWRQSFGYRLESLKIRDVAISFSDAFREAEAGGSPIISAVSMNLIRDKRIGRGFLVTNGSLFSINNQIQTRWIGSYADLYHLSLQGNIYRPLFRSSILKLSASLSQVYKIGNKPPRIFNRLFAGGLYTIRGFPEREVGPVDLKNTEPIGGRSRFLASMELQQSLGVEDKLYGVLFVDAGNVWEKEFNFDLTEMNVGAGVGIRLVLPIGIIRLDYGIPLIREYSHLHSGSRVYFDISARF